MIDIYWAYLLERRLKNDLNEENIKKDKDKKEKAKKEKKINKDVCAFCGQNINFCICNTQAKLTFVNPHYVLNKNNTTD